jgi:ADP-heptose:LPS heptosyltransferase
MKILVMSLLRVGDVLLAAPVLRALKDENPKVEIHLLLNSQCLRVAPLMPFVDRFIPFEREEIQRGLGQAEIPFFASHQILSSLVEDLNSQGYDRAVNITHNRLSGWLLGLIDAKEKIGLSLDAQGRANIKSNWFLHLNSQSENEGFEAFHYADIFRFALGLDSLPTTSLIETPRGKKTANDLIASTFSSNQGLICVQALTSDVKKTWGLTAFAKALRVVSDRHAGVAFAVLGAEFEKAQLEPWVNSLKAQGINAQLVIADFETAFSVLRRSKLLLTLDTSIKHLAAAGRVPTVEISLGSADPYRTGVYLHGGIVVQSRENCAPCVHSKPCHREKHFCASRIPSDMVGMVVSEVFAGREFQLQTIAEEYQDEVDLLRVDLKNAGFWSATPVLEKFSEEEVGRWIDRVCRKIWLDQSENRTADKFGTEVIALCRLLRKSYPEVSEIEWRHLLGDFEKQSTLVEGRINGFKAGIRFLHGAFEDPKRMQEFVNGLISFREKMRPSPLLGSFRSALDRLIEDDISPSFTRFRHIVDVVSEIEKRTIIYLRIIRGLGLEIEPEAGVERL